MKKEIWQSDQPVLSDDLSLAQSSKEEAVKERLTDSFDPGIARSELGEFAFSVNGAVNTSFDISTGIAYDPDGERIIVSSGLDTYINPTVSGSVLVSGDPSTLDGDPNGPLTTTDDGDGGFTLTPQISGCKGIPMASFIGSVGYVFIAYLQTTDTLVFTLQDITNKKLFTKGGDGYQITVVESNSISTDPATLNPDTSKYLYLGYVDFLTGSFLTPGGFNTVGRSVYALKSARLSATTPDITKSDRTLVYGASQAVSLDEHIKAVGSGLVTPTNPHGTSSADLGLTGKTTSQHEQYFHASGIIGDQSSTTSSLYGVVNDVSGAALPPTYGLDTFKIRQLSSVESVNVNGITLSSADIPALNEFYLVSSTGVILPDGAYRLFLNNSSKTIRLAVVASAGSSVSDTTPQLSSNPGDTVSINVNSDGVQSIVLGLNASGATVASNIQTAVRALTAANPSIQPAYAAFTATFTGGVYVLTSGAYNAGSNSVVVSSALGIAALLKLGTANGGTEAIGAGGGGTYRRVISSVFVDLLTEDYTTVTADANNFPLYDLIWLGSSGPSAGNNNIPSSTDLRIFGTLDSENLSRDSATDTVVINHNVSVSGNLTVVGNNNILPAGVVLPFAGRKINIPAFFLYCDGQLYDRLDPVYTPLFNAIGYDWGGDGAQYFRTPDGRGGFLRGASDITSLSFTADATTNLLTSAAHLYQHSGIPVRFTTTGTLPAPLALNTTYWVIWISTTTFKVATTHANAISGTLIDITTAGTGVHTAVPWMDPDASTREASAPGGATGDSVGTYQAGGVETHVHTQTFLSYNFGVGGGGSGNPGSPLTTDTGAYGSAGDTRPLNNAYNFIIKI